MDIKSTVVGEVSLITLENDYLKVVTTNYGAALFHVYVKEGTTLHEVSVQPDNLDDFLTSSFYYGKTIGRTAGRLFLPSYDIDDITYVLPDEGKPSFIHGGSEGFSFKHFTVKSYSRHDVIFEAVSLSEEGPYDGDMTLEVMYRLEEDVLKVRFRASTTETSLCNITNHIYLNISNEVNINNHHIAIQAQTYLNIDGVNKVKSVDKVHGPFDFTRPKRMKPQLDKMEQTPFKGYDHTFILNKKNDYDMMASTKQMDFFLKTSYPAVVVYTHNNLAPYQLKGLDVHDNKHVAFTVECQFEPGGIQVKGLNQALLNSNETYEHSMDMQFKIK